MLCAEGALTGGIRPYAPRHQRNQLDNFEALLSGEAGQTALRESFEAAAAASSLGLTTRRRRTDAAVGGYDALSRSTSMPMFESLLNSTQSSGGSAMTAMRQAHALAHGQHGPPGGRASYPGSGHRAQPRRRQKKKRGKKKRANGYQDGYSLTSSPDPAGYRYGSGSPSRSRSVLVRGTGESEKSFLPQLSSPPPVGNSNSPSPSARHRDTDSPSYRDYKKQATKQQPQRRRQRAQRTQRAQQQQQQQQPPVDVPLSNWGSK